MNKKNSISLVDYLFLKESAYDFLQESIDTIMFPKEPKNEYEALIQASVRRAFKKNLDIIFEFAESPIEKIFLNALLLQLIMYGPYIIIFTEPLIPANQMIYDLREGYNAVMNFWQRFQDATGADENGERFTAYILDSPDLNLTIDEKNSILNYLYNWYALKSVNVFHLSLQCQFDDISVNGKNIRPDILIWVPSRPDFKLIVECDGFQYHSDKRAFTNDRERDRTLQNQGFQVLRFSGSEIVNNPVNKARELHSYLIEQQQEMFREEIMDDLHYYSQQASE